MSNERATVETQTVKDDEERKANSPLLEARGVTKRFGAVVAVDNVDFALYEREVVALVGDNGAGKSTFIKVLCGALQPDTGEIRVDGRPVHFNSPKDAQNLGIETVYQDLALFEDLAISANVFLGREKKYWHFLLDHKGMFEFTKELIQRLRVDVPNPKTNVRTLSGGQRQAVAVARSVAFGTRIFILDEPTSALGKAAADQVLSIIHDLKQQGYSVIVISHNLEHVLDVADRIVVLRQGRVVGDLPRADANPQEVVRLIVGG